MILDETDGPIFKFECDPLARAVPLVHGAVICIRYAMTGIVLMPRLSIRRHTTTLHTLDASGTDAVARAELNNFRR